LVAVPGETKRVLVVFVGRHGRVILRNDYATFVNQSLVGKAGDALVIEIVGRGDLLDTFSFGAKLVSR